MANLLEALESSIERMNRKELSNFVKIYMPFTLLCYEKIKPDVKIMINKEHDYYNIKF